jgi:YesN/AraC family two-component response regulator
MKAIYALLPDFATTYKPFVVRKISLPSFSSDFHFHNECQLVYIVSGTGTRIIGDSVESYKEGDLAFVGPNVPHVWYSKTSPNQEEKMVISVALYINPVTVAEHLKPFIDTQALAAFFEKSARGISIVGAKREIISTILQETVHQKEVPLLASFLKILELLMDSEDIIWLNDASLLKTYSSKNQGRVSKLMHFIQENFRTEITLEQAASVADLQLHSFCRFFKQLTHHTFSDFLNEVRIGFACKLLQQSDLPVTQVGYESGYGNISYFNRTFKKIHGITPRDYRQKLMVEN